MIFPGFGGSEAEDMAKTVWITGATRGLGRGLVEGFVGAGWTVAGCGRWGEQESGKGEDGLCWNSRWRIAMEEVSPPDRSEIGPSQLKVPAN